MHPLCLPTAALLLLLLASNQGKALSLKEDRTLNPDSTKLPEASSHELEGRGDHEHSQIDEKSGKIDDCQHLAKAFSAFGDSERRRSELPICRCDADHSEISVVEMMGPGAKRAARFCKDCPGVEIKQEHGHQRCEDQKKRPKPDFKDFCSQVPNHCKELVYYECQCPSDTSEDVSDTPTPVNGIQNSSYSIPDSVATVMPIIVAESSSPTEAIDDFLSYEEVLQRPSTLGEWPGFDPPPEADTRAMK